MIEIKNVVGHIKPLLQTNLRSEYSTYATSLGSYPAGAVVEIDQVMKRLVTEEGKPHNYQSDVWGRVVKIDNKAVSGWMAIDYHKKSFEPLKICTPYYEVVDEEPPPDPEPPSVEVPPFAFHLNYHSGEWTVLFNGKEYVPKEGA